MDGASPLPPLLAGPFARPFLGQTPLEREIASARADYRRAWDSYNRALQAWLQVQSSVGLPPGGGLPEGVFGVSPLWEGAYLALWRAGEETHRAHDRLRRASQRSARASRQAPRPVFRRY